MRYKSSKRYVVSVLFLQILFSFVIAVVCFFFLTRIFPAFSRYVSDTVDWGVLDGFVGLLSFSLLVGGVIFALVKYLNEADSRELEMLAHEREEAKYEFDIFQEIFKTLTAPEQAIARRWILSNIIVKRDDEDIDTWYKKANTIVMHNTHGIPDDLSEGQKAMILTLNGFDYIGLIASKYWKLEKDSLDWFAGPIATTWKRIGPYVLYERRLRNTPNRHISAQYIGSVCIEWQRNKGIPEENIVARTSI